MALVFVVLLIVGAGRLFRKHGPARFRGLPPEAIEILGRKNIDQHQTIHLVRLGARILVLGSSSNELRTLAEITDPMEIDFLAGVCRQNENSQNIAQSFRSLFSKQLPPQTPDLQSSFSQSAFSQPPPSQQSSRESETHLSDEEFRLSDRNPEEPAEVHG